MATWISLDDVASWLPSKLPYFVAQSDSERLTAALESAGFDVRALDGSDVPDEQSLLASLGKELSFPSYYGANWDAFVDCMGDLAASNPTPLAVVWNRADVMAGASLTQFVRAVHLLLSTTEDLGMADEPYQVEVFFVGVDSASIATVP